MGEKAHASPTASARVSVSDPFCVSQSRSSVQNDGMVVFKPIRCSASRDIFAAASRRSSGIDGHELLVRGHGVAFLEGVEKLGDVVHEVPGGVRSETDALAFPIFRGSVWSVRYRLHAKVRRRALLFSADRERGTFLPLRLSLFCFA